MFGYGLLGDILVTLDGVVAAPPLCFILKLTPVLL